MTRPWQRWALSLGVLGALLLWLDPSRIGAEVAWLHPGWLLLALVTATVQTALSAWRWRYTASRLGLRLSPAEALADYYLAGFVNQVVPGGVIGDAWRAQRHARISGRTGPAWRAVILERASGQLIVVALALLVLLVLAPWQQALISIPASGYLWPLLVGVVGLSVIAMSLRGRWQPLLGLLQEDISRALLAPTAWPRQLVSSLLIVLSYLLVFACAARGIGLDAPLTQLMLLALPVLLAMLIPLSVAGWGFREGAAAGVWLLSGLPPEQGVAVSIAYGVTVLLASLPGALVLSARPSAQVHIDQ